MPGDLPDGAVWRYFAQLTAIPRPSGHEEGVRTWLRETAAREGWEYREDAAGNVCLAVPGTATGPVLVLQAHMDMVCEHRAGLNVDFLTTGIRTVVDGEYVRADGTSLGADNGIGIALALAVATAELPARVPLELLFTMDEETGLTGAMNLDPAIVHGRRILNLDSEEDGFFTVGCAGGIDVTARFPVVPVRAMDAWRVAVEGCQGGHSGVNIAAGRANAIRLLADILAEVDGAVLHSIDGGTKKNAIPRACAAVVSGVAPAALRAAAVRAARAWQVAEPTVEVSVRPVFAPPRAGCGQIVAFLRAVPCGVVAMDSDFPDLVFTSNSIGVVTTAAHGVSVVMHGRSARDADRDAMAAAIIELAEAHGGTAVLGGGYPGWPPNPDAALVAEAVAAWRDLFGADPQVSTLHAGLEAGIIGAKLGTSEMLAVGPRIDNPHSPAECVHIPSVERVYRFLERLVQS